MKARRRLALILALLAGGAPLVTVATCDQAPYGGGFSLFSTGDPVGYIFGGDDDDDDD